MATRNWTHGIWRCLAAISLLAVSPLLASPEADAPPEPSPEPIADASPAEAVSPTPTPRQPVPAAAPAWAATAIYYEVIPSRFRNGDLANDPTIDMVGETRLLPTTWQLSRWTADWYARAPWEVAMGANFFENGLSSRRYGGDLEGAIQSLNYLGDLGVNAVILTRVFQSRADNTTEVSSLHHADPSFGPLALEDAAAVSAETEDPATWSFTQADRLLLEFIRQAHARGIRVLLRLDFTHIGRDFFAFRELRREQEKSRFKDWFVVTQYDDAATGKSEFKYNGWRGRDSSPEFARDEHGLASGPLAYVHAAVRRWSDPNGDGDFSDGVDGWVVDSAAELPMSFWAEWNHSLHEMNAAAFTICATRHSAEAYLKEGGFSTATDFYGFAIPTKGFFIDGKLKGSDFAALLAERREPLPLEKRPLLLNLVDSSQTDRVASMAKNPATEAYEPSQIPYDVANSAERSESYDITRPDARTRALQRMIALMQTTYRGTPAIYYGTEAGMWGGDEPDNRMPMVWEDLKFAPRLLDPRGKPRTEDDPNFDLPVYSFYKQVVQLRRDYRAFNGGALDFLEVAGDPRAFAFARTLDDQRVVVVFNRSEQARDLLLPASPIIDAFNTPAMIFTTAETPDGVGIRKSDAGISITMPGLTGVVLGGR